MKRLKREDAEPVMRDLENVRHLMQEQAIDAWLVYDFRGSNPVMWQLLDGAAWTTRRSFLLIPREGAPRLLAHALDRDQLLDEGLLLESYTSWEEMNRWLNQHLTDTSRIAMEYSPDGMLPTMSLVDAGTIELIRGFDVEIVSSADLFQLASIWTETAYRSQRKVGKEIVEIKDAAFDFIRAGVKTDTALTEYGVQEFILRAFTERGLETEHRPIVAVNENSGNPHYEPIAERCRRIMAGDWVLIDLWARYPGDENVFVDTTWVGYVGSDIPETHQKTFDIVRGAQTQVISRLKTAWETGEVLEGWQLDDVARDHIREAGYAEYFLHRTGHSMGPGPVLQALGVNLDNLETHDTRRVIPGIGFSVEPGIYLDDFGVRLESDVYMHPESGPVVTPPPQERIIRLA